MASSRKRQARLAFTPLPSSSPAAKSYHKQIQDRAAAVSLEPSSSPAKRRKLRDDLQFDGVNDSMPTPAASLQQGIRDAIAESSESDSEPIRSTQRRSNTQSRIASKRKQRQQRIDFSNARDPDSFSSPLKLSSPVRPQSSGRAGIFATQRQRTVVDISSDESDGDLPSPRKLIGQTEQPRTKKDSTMKNNTAARKTRSAQQITIASGSEDDNIVVANEQPLKTNEQESEVDDDDDDDDMPTTMGTQRRRRARRSSRSSFISSLPPRVEDSDDELEIIEKPKRRGRKHSNDVNENEDEDQPTTPSRGRLKRSKRRDSREEEDLAEDLDFLAPSSDIESSTRKPRNTQSKQKSARQKALDRLKRRRSGLQADVESGDDGVNGDAADTNEDYQDGDDYTDDYNNHGRQRPQRPMSSSQVFKENEDDQDFIDSDSDEEAPLGAPPEVPLEFTSFARMKAKELFPWAVEWMVQKKINPAFNSTDGVYELTFRKLDDEVKGLAGSKFMSSVWTPDFSAALKARPDIAYEPIDRSSAEHFMRDHCDACNRSNHPATYQIQFQGHPYDRHTLEEVERSEDVTSDSEDSNQDADDLPAYNADGAQIPAANTIFYVGKFCMSNAQTAHALQHWRFHLNEWMVNWLEQQGHNTPEKIVQRDRLSTEKRKKIANGIADEMEHAGVVKTLWRDFRQNIDDARNSKQGRYRDDSP